MKKKRRRYANYIYSHFDYSQASFNSMFSDGDRTEIKQGRIYDIIRRVREGRGYMEAGHCPVAGANMHSFQLLTLKNEKWLGTNRKNDRETHRHSNV